MMTPSGLPGAAKMAGMLYEEAVTRYYPRFSRGAYLVPSTAENRVAVQCLLEAWPPIEQALEAPESQDTLENMGNLLKLITAARIIREDLEAGFRIVEPNAKTPGTTPKG